MDETDFTIVSGDQFTDAVDVSDKHWVCVTGPDEHTVVAVVSEGALRHAQTPAPLHVLIADADAEFVAVADGAQLQKSPLFEDAQAWQHSVIVVTADALASYGQNWSDSFPDGPGIMQACLTCTLDHEPGECPLA